MTDERHEATPDEPHEATADEPVHRVPGLPKDLKQVYDGLLHAGATSPGGARSLEYLSKELHHPKKQMLHELHVLEGKGVVGHETSGHDTSWYLRK